MQKIMLKKEIKEFRSKFRETTFNRDKCCVLCGFKSDNNGEYDCHHITPRDIMPFGGYTKWNGVMLCSDKKLIDPELNCHEKAESPSCEIEFPNSIYKKIGSSYNKAYIESMRLGLYEKEVQENTRKILETFYKAKQISKKFYKDSNADVWLLACEEDNQILKNYGIGLFLLNTK